MTYRNPYEAAEYGRSWGVRATISGKFIVVGMAEGYAKAKAREMNRDAFADEAREEEE